MQTENNNWEMRDLAEAIQRVQQAGGKVTFKMMIEWKRGRGMVSCHEMSSERKQVAWLRQAMRYLETKES